jgi:hypothetical protein
MLATTDFSRAALSWLGLLLSLAMVVALVVGV